MSKLQTKHCSISQPAKPEILRACALSIIRARPEGVLGYHIPEQEVQVMGNPSMSL